MYFCWNKPLFFFYTFFLYDWHKFFYEMFWFHFLQSRAFTFKRRKITKLYWSVLIWHWHMSNKMSYIGFLVLVKIIDILFFLYLCWNNHKKWWDSLRWALKLNFCKNFNFFLALTFLYTIKPYLLLYIELKTLFLQCCRFNDLKTLFFYITYIYKRPN